MPVLNDWEWYFDVPTGAGLTFGGATDFGLLRIDGLPTLPESKEDIVSKTGADGAFVFSGYYKERYVTIEGEIVGDSLTDFFSKIETWRTTFREEATDHNLEWKRPGQVQKRIKCRVIRRSLVDDTNSNLGYGLWVVQFVAQDTRIYNTSDAELSSG